MGILMVSQTNHFKHLLKYKGTIIWKNLKFIKADMS
jgi:hypothetical protein